jgi:predicted transcriptional regulator
MDSPSGKEIAALSQYLHEQKALLERKMQINEQIEEVRRQQKRGD